MALLRREDIILDARGVAWLVTGAIHNAWRLSSPARVVSMGAFRGESYDLLELHEPVSDQLPIDARVLDRDERLAELATLKPRERRDLYLHALGFTYEEIAVDRAADALRVPAEELAAARHDRNRGRDRPFGRPPAQIPACAANALGSCLGCGRRSAR